jgi:hypothetical protein
MRAHLLAMIVVGTMLGCGSKPPPPTPAAPTPAPAPAAPKADPSDARVIVPSDNPSADVQVNVVTPKEE